MWLKTTAIRKCLNFSFNTLVFFKLLMFVGISTADDGDVAMPDAQSPQGIDVSHYQGDIDWEQVKKAGVEFAFIKCTDSTSNRDSKFDANWAGSKNAGIPRGAYHFFHPEADAISQANFFLACFNAGLGELPPVIDVEQYSDDFANLECQDVIDRIKAFTDTVSKNLNIPVMIYTNPSTWETNMCEADIFDAHGIWIAKYSNTLEVSGKWEKWNFWQYSQTGQVDGIAGNVDLNRFNGTADQLDAILK